MEKGTKIILAILLLVIVLLVIFGGYYLTQTKTTIFSRAATTDAYNLDNSYLFVDHVQAKADGQEKIKVSAFLLSGEGKGVPNKTVTLVSQPGLNISEIQSNTSDKGEAIFVASTTNAGRYILQAAVEGKVFPQSVTLTFN